MKKTIVLLPTYNEAQNIGPLLTQIHREYPGLHMLIIDDRSPDGTNKIVEKMMKDTLYLGKLHLIVREKRSGLAAAYIEGFQWCLDQGFETIMQMDADGSHDPKYIKNFLQEIETHDLIIGSRYIDGGGSKGWSPLRRLLSTAANHYARLWLGFGIRDATSGYRCFRSTALDILDLQEINTTGYVFQIEMLCKVTLKDLTIKEIPICFSEREKGKSKMSINILFEGVFSVPKMWRYCQK